MNSDMDKNIKHLLLLQFTNTGNKYMIINLYLQNTCKAQQWLKFMEDYKEGK